MSGGQWNEYNNKGPGNKKWSNFKWNIMNIERIHSNKWMAVVKGMWNLPFFFVGIIFHLPFLKRLGIYFKTPVRVFPLTNSILLCFICALFMYGDEKVGWMDGWFLFCCLLAYPFYQSARTNDRVAKLLIRN